MGKDYHACSRTVRDTYEEAASVLGYDLAAVSFEGPMDTLSRTDVTQPALLAQSTAVARLLVECDVSCECALGHSLGEYSALVATGAVSFADALRAVKLRGEAMLAAAERHPGGMAAVIGLEDDAVEALCAGIDDVWPANFNSPGQVVVSGSLSGLNELEERAPARGARKVVRLPVSGAFHSPHMEEAAAELGTFLDGLAWYAPRPAFYSVSTLRFETGQAGSGGVDEARGPVSFASLLREQVTAPVRFSQAIRALTGAGYDEFVEVGPSAVLSGLIRRIAPEAATMGTADREAFEAAVARIGPAGADEDAAPTDERVN